MSKEPALFKLLPFVDSYHPLATLATDLNVTQLFSTVTIEDLDLSLTRAHGQALWLNIPGLFNGRSIHVTPGNQLMQLIRENNIYGEPFNRDLYLQVLIGGRGTHLYFRFQHIIGCRCLFELTPKQLAQLEAMYATR